MQLFPHNGAVSFSSLYCINFLCLAFFHHAESFSQIKSTLHGIFASRSTLICSRRHSFKASSSSSLLYSTHRTKVGDYFNVPSYNDTSLSVSSIADVERTFTTVPKDEEKTSVSSMSDVERTFTNLPKDEEKSVKFIETLESSFTNNTLEITTTASDDRPLQSADILGPVFSIIFAVSFLLYTLLHSGGISDKFLTMDFSHKMNILSRISWFPGRFQEAQILVALIMSFSAFAQALTGFGFAVVAVGAMSSMPWLLNSELYDVITPVAATLGSLVGFILLIPYAFATGPKTQEEPGLEWNEILPLLIPCTILTPVGIKLNSMIDPLVGTRILAVLILGFVAYKLVPTIQDIIGATGDNAPSQEDTTNEHDPISDVNVVESTSNEESLLTSKAAAVLFGAAAGIFGGAFDVQGPPLCIYGDAKGWGPAQFRNNVLAVVALDSVLVLAIDSYQGALSNFYYSYFCITSLPGVLLGIVLGQWVSKRIDPVLFKNLVLVMCMGLGIKLLTLS